MINSLRKDLLISLFCVAITNAPFCPNSVYIEVEIAFQRTGHPKRSVHSIHISLSKVYFRLTFQLSTKSFQQPTEETPIYLQYTYL